MYIIVKIYRVFRRVQWAGVGGVFFRHARNDRCGRGEEDDIRDPDDVNGQYWNNVSPVIPAAVW